MVAVGAIIEHPTNKRILLLKRSSCQDFSAGIWEYITGRLNQFEEPEKGLKREIKEEAGLEIKIIKPISIYHLFRGKEIAENELVGIIYWGKAISDKVKLSEEHTAYQWVTLDEAFKMIKKSSMQKDLRAFQNTRP